MSEKKRILYLVAGESGSGKDAIIDEVCRRHGLKKVKSCTTRPKRTPDENTHYFISDAVFDEHLSDMVATTTFDGNRYGAAVKTVNASDFYIIDPEGIKSLKRDMIDREIHTIWITANEEKRRSRMIMRGQTPDEAEQRIEHDRKAFSDFHALKLWNNGDIKESVYNMEILMRVFENE